jgi:hypothetical protein
MADNTAVLGAPVSLFHTATGVAYADIEIDQHRETWPIRGKQFRAWLRRRHYDRTREAMGLATIRSGSFFQCGPRKVLPPASSPLSCSTRPTLHRSSFDLWTLPDFTSLRCVPMMTVPPVIVSRMHEAL